MPFTKKGRTTAFLFFNTAGFASAKNISSFMQQRQICIVFLIEILLPEIPVDLKVHTPSK
jgi:hypothetical protein